METGTDFSDLALADPMGAIRQISLDLGGQTAVKLSDGREMTAAQIQREIRRRALKALGDEEVTELYSYLFDLWDRALNAIDSRDWSGIDTEIDYAIKKRLVDAYVARTGADLGDPRIARLLLAYHDITNAGVAPKLEQSGAMVRLTSKQQIETAVDAPPATTRALLRAAAISAAEMYRRDLGVDWVNLRLEGSGTLVALQDPFATQDERVDELIARMSRD